MKCPGLHRKDMFDTPSNRVGCGWLWMSRKLNFFVRNWMKFPNQHRCHVCQPSTLTCFGNWCPYHLTLRGGLSKQDFCADLHIYINIWKKTLCFGNQPPPNPLDWRVPGRIPLYTSGHFIQFLAKMFWKLMTPQPWWGRNQKHDFSVQIWIFNLFPAKCTTLRGLQRWHFCADLHVLFSSKGKKHCFGNGPPSVHADPWGWRLSNMIFLCRFRASLGKRIFGTLPHPSIPIPWVGVWNMTILYRSWPVI